MSKKENNRKSIKQCGAKEPHRSKSIKTVPLATDILSPDQFADYKDTFSDFDLNKDDRMEFSELGKLMRTLGLNPPEKELTSLFNEFDAEGSGYLNLNQFSLLMHKKTKDVDVEEEVKQLFTVFDKDEVGNIPELEMRFVLEYIMAQNIDDKVTDKEINLLMKSLDKNSDGAISIYELLQFMIPIKDDENEVN